MRTPILTVLALAAIGTTAPAAAQSPAKPVRLVTRAVSSGPAIPRYQGGQEQTDRQTKSFRIGARGDIQITILAGDISVTRGSGDDATIEVLKRSRARTADEARQMLDLVQVDVTERNGHVEVRTRYPRGDEFRRDDGRRNMNVSVDLAITAPAGTRIFAHSVAGDMKATGITGDLSFETVSGDLTISGASRITSAKSVSGDITITDTEADGTIEANSVSGTVTLRKAKVRGVDLGSVSGDIVVEDVACERADLHSFSGNVEFGGSFASSGRYEMKSHSGNIRLTLAGTTGFDVEASTFSGTVRSDLPLQLAAADRATDRGHRRSLRGTFGDGSAILALTSFSGNIIIGKR